MKKELMWFIQHFGLSDEVTYNVRYSPTGKPTFGVDYRVTSATLTLVAESRGRPTWDEHDIITAHGTFTSEVITLPS